jgi:hypothetical protein
MFIGIVTKNTQSKKGPLTRSIAEFKGLPNVSEPVLYASSKRPVKVTRKKAVLMYEK